MVILYGISEVMARAYDKRKADRSPNAGLSPDEAVTSGSLSIQESGTAIRIVCAELRSRLIERAAERLGVVPEVCSARDGEVIDGASGRRIDYRALDPASLLEGEVATGLALEPASTDSTDPARNATSIAEPILKSLRSKSWKNGS